MCFHFSILVLRPPLRCGPKGVCGRKRYFYLIPVGVRKRLNYLPKTQKVAFRAFWEGDYAIPVPVGVPPC